MLDLFSLNCHTFFNTVEATFSIFKGKQSAIDMASPNSGQQFHAASTSSVVRQAKLTYKLLCNFRMFYSIQNDVIAVVVC